MLRPKSSTSSARCRKVWVLKLRELLIPPLQDPSHDRLGSQQRRANLPLEFARVKQLPQHRAVGTKDAGQGGIEFGFDTPGVLIELRDGFFKGTGQRSNSPSMSC